MLPREKPDTYSVNVRISLPIQVLRCQIAGPVAEHHDGFSMWDSKVNEWNVARMGPKRDVSNPEYAGLYGPMHNLDGLKKGNIPKERCRDNLLYATCLGWPEKKATIRSMKRLYPGEIESVRMLGIDKELEWSVTKNGLEIDVPDEKPCEDAFVFKIIRKNSF